MSNKNLLAVVMMLVTPLLVSAQLNPKTETARLKKHIGTLASDKFEGRETGKQGEKLAASYIAEQFKEIGLIPKGDSGYYQAFKFNSGSVIGRANWLFVGNNRYVLRKDFYPLAYSPEEISSRGLLIHVGYGIVAPKLGYDDYQGKDMSKQAIAVIDISTPDHGGPHSKYAEYADLRSRIDTAVARGAFGVIFIRNSNDVEDADSLYSSKITPCSVPVIFVKQHLNDSLRDFEKCGLSANLIKKEAIGYNLAGYINNNAKKTIIIGAHYDHLGMGGSESLYRGEPAIHNGADDNASGTAGLIELAKYLKREGPKSNNYLFLAFSGEEKGLLGSGHWVKNPTIDLDSVNYMLNMDMIGRIKKEEPVLLINGTGTSDAWKVTMDYIKTNAFKIKTTESGVGPSDHTSFYLKGVPVLHFFSGTHSDYHKPSDDENKINYEGEVDVLNYMIQLIQKLDDKGKLTFIKTKDETSESAPKFKVTLGVIPDYSYEGTGMKIDGITEGKTASKAGMKSGDVVIQLGEYKVLDMMSYMTALGKFNKGDKTTVIFLRDKKEQKAEIEF